jgi:hypothetical protein
LKRSEIRRKINAERKKEEREGYNYSNTNLNKMDKTLNMRNRKRRNVLLNTFSKKPDEEDERIIKGDLFISNGHNKEERS